MQPSQEAAVVGSPGELDLADMRRRVAAIFVGSIGNLVEWYDFYAYSAFALYFASAFFPGSDPVVQQLNAAILFAIGFIVRPVGGWLFGHLADAYGRRQSLMASVLLMCFGSLMIAVTPSYASIGIAAPILLALCRFGQGLGLGGEWGGAVLLAVENAPPGKRAWYGMFPQLGAPIGFFFSGSIFLALSSLFSDEQFFAYGWRLPFLASSVLVAVGLYVRLTITETPAFQKIQHEDREKVPVFTVLRDHLGTLVAGTAAGVTTFVLFYLMTVFTLSWGTTALHFTRDRFLIIQLFGVVCFGITIPISAKIAERGRRATMLWVTVAIGLFGLILGPLFQAGTVGAVLTLALGLGLMGMTYGPIGTVLSELFPTAVRYTGSSLTFNLAGIVGASLAPYIAMWLATNYGLPWVGYYLTASAAVTFVGLLATRETRDVHM